MASLLLLSGLGAPVENRPNQHQMVPTFPANNFKSCVSTAVEMKSQVCSNICNNADKISGFLQTPFFNADGSKTSILIRIEKWIGDFEAIEP